MNKKLILGVFALLVASILVGVGSVSAYHYNSGYYGYNYGYHSSYSKDTNCNYHGCTTEVVKNTPHGSTYYRTSSYNHYPAPHYYTYRVNSAGYGNSGYLYEPNPVAYYMAHSSYGYRPYYGYSYRGYY